MQDGELLIFGLCGQSLFFRVAHMHRPEETLHAQSLCREPGGKGYNQAVAAARLGARVTFAATVGRDADADDCAALLAREGVQARLFPKAGEHTACAVILTDAAGENRVTVYPGASRLLDAQDVLAMAGAFARASVVLLTPEIPEPAFAQAVALAREAGARLIVNPAPFVPWVVPYLREAWCVTPNRQEAGQLPGLDGGEPLERALRTAPYARMAVTLGAQGALCLASGAVFAVPAPRVVPVDTTGAGDAFNGALCAALLADAPFPQAVSLAVRAASLSVAQPRAVASFPTREALEASVRSAPGREK